MEPYFLLTFGTTLGRTRTLRINSPNVDVTDDQVRDAMNNMVTTQTVIGASGQINTLRQASLIETFVSPIDLTA